MSPSKVSDFLEPFQRPCDVECLHCLGKNVCSVGAPLLVTEDLIKTFNISLVVRGTVSECQQKNGKVEDRYSYPKSKGIFR